MQNSQPSVNDDRGGLDGEAEDPGVVGSVSEDDLLPLGVFFWEKADFWDAVVLREDRKQTFMSCDAGGNRLQCCSPEGHDKTEM